ncbi:MAG TPA: molybdopterin-binding protein [Actinocrinis sp.]|nr:molybdopterin-binding protein [Actinocrinis sp.]
MSLLTTALLSPPADVAPTTVRDVPWARARESAHAAGAARPSAARPAALADAAGLTLAADLRARLPLPSFDTAAMDGFAVAGLGSDGWRLRGVVRAGAGWPGEPLAPGEAVEISTGALVPPGAHAILPLERATTDGPLVHGPVRAYGDHIRRTGEDAPAGTRMAAAGSRVNPALIGLAAACGCDVLSVRPRPRVQVLVTGDELVDSGQPAAGSGFVRDALGPMLPPLVTAFGGQVTGVAHVPDRPSGSLAAAVRAAGDADVVVVTGSTSVGATDQLRHLLHDSGARWIVDGVACRPGHPQLLAEAAGAGPWIVGLPGNPYAALAAAHTLLGPLLDGLSGRALRALPTIPVSGDVSPAKGNGHGHGHDAGLTRLIPASWAGAGAEVVSGHRAAFLRGAALADAIAALPPDWVSGDPAPLILLTG